MQLEDLIQTLLLLGAALNVAAAGRAWCAARSPARAVAWLLVAGVFAVLFGLSVSGHVVGLPETLKRAINVVATPLWITVAAYVGLFAAFALRRFMARSAVAWSVFNLALIWLALSLEDAPFAAVVTAPDNLPIVAMVFLLGGFTWLGLTQAVANDARVGCGKQTRSEASRGQGTQSSQALVLSILHRLGLRRHTTREVATAQPRCVGSEVKADVSAGPVEKQFAEKVLVWPDLVYIELIAALLLTTLLIVWSLVVRAPLEPPANPAITPNPAKAPWYFLGLQELLGFADAWWIGVMVPLLILVGLSAIPYLDRSPSGSGYYSIRGRRFAWVVFLGGFFLLWILPILLGTFVRGPNWSAFGPYEARDPQKITAETNVRLSDVVWTDLLKRDAPPSVLLRELPGIAILGLYLIGLPLLLERYGLRWARMQLGLGRYWLMTLLLLLMLTLPAKMLLRWSFGLSYIVSMPEYGLNF